MDLLMSVMSTGTVFTRDHLCRYYADDGEPLQAGSAASHKYYQQIHATSYPMQDCWAEIIGAADRVLVPVRDPIRSLLTGVAKGNDIPAQIQRVRGWRGVLSVWDEFKFYPLPIDMKNLDRRDDYWSDVFGGMRITWETVRNSTRQRPHVAEQAYLYEKRGVLPLLPAAVLEEWREAAPEMQVFMARLGYQPLPWWR